jgi:hypothetical protein
MAGVAGLGVAGTRVAVGFEPPQAARPARANSRPEMGRTNERKDRLVLPGKIVIPVIIQQVEVPDAIGSSVDLDLPLCEFRTEVNTSFFMINFSTNSIRGPKFPDFGLHFSKLSCAHQGYPVD